MTQDALSDHARRRALTARVVRVYLRPHAAAITVALVCAGLAGALYALLAWLLDPAVKRILVDHDRAALIGIPLLIIGVGLFRGAIQFIQVILTNRVGNQLVADVQGQLFGHLIRSDLAQLRAAHTGAHVSSVLYDAGLIRDAATTGLVNYVQFLLTVVGVVVVMFVQDPVLALLVLVAGPVVALVFRRFVRRTHSAAVDAMEETSALSTAVMESLDGARIVKIEGREAYEEARVGEVIRRRLQHLVRGSNAKSLAPPATDVVVTVVIAAVIAYAGWRSLGGAIDLGDLLSFLVALTLGGQALRGMAGFQTLLTEGLAAAGRVFAALDVAPAIADAPGARELPAGPGRVRFETVSFGYAPGAPAVDAITLEAAPGQTVALVGPSGGGKSTLLALIPRFHDVQAGRILIDGHDVREVTLASLRARIGLVTQEPFLFDDTVRANIAYARPGASQAEIENAARAAAAHEFITELPQGYDTRVGEAGGRLSGGQRQRVAIARAFLKDAPILLLDEATSALDTESEARVQEALERLMAGRTTLLIAHRLSTVRKADLIHVIDRGRLVESGTHEALLAAGGLYARLARSQDLQAEAA
ncbi:MAG TPA: ABC transporter ATP-binding protein [Caulobacteraceae bacterium]